MSAQYNFKYINELNICKFLPMKDQDFFRDKVLEAKSVSNGIVIPYKPLEQPEMAAGGVLQSTGEYCTISAQRIVGKEMNQGYLCEDYKTSDKKVVFFGAFHPHWGHFLTEMVARCWYFLDHNIEEENYYVAYIRKWDSCQSGLQGNYLEFLELLGIPSDRIIEVSEATQFQEIVIPELAGRGGIFYTKQYVDIFNAVRDAVEISENNFPDLYFTRLQSKELRNSELGEKRIKKIFEQNKYKVIAAEHCTLRDQIRYIKNCKEMVVMEGTLPHNILFAKDEINLTIIKRTGEINSYQTLINQVRNARVTYVDVAIALFPVFSGGPFLLHISEQFIAYATDYHMKMNQKKDNAIRLHIQLIWYFLCYLENITNECVEHWGLKEKYGEYFMGHYGFYRKQLTNYDKKLVRKFRKCFYILARLFE